MTKLGGLRNASDAILWLALWLGPRPGCEVWARRIEHRRAANLRATASFALSFHFRRPAIAILVLVNFVSFLRNRAWLEGAGRLSAAPEYPGASLQQEALSAALWLRRHPSIFF
jgi:hypothetical protein